MFVQRQVNGLRLAQLEGFASGKFLFFPISLTFFDNDTLVHTWVRRDQVFSERKSGKIYAVTGDNSASIYM